MWKMSPRTLFGNWPLATRFRTTASTPIWSDSGRLTSGSDAGHEVDGGHRGRHASAVARAARDHGTDAPTAPGQAARRAVSAGNAARAGGCPAIAAFGGAAAAGDTPGSRITSPGYGFRAGWPGFAASRAETRVPNRKANAQSVSP